MIDRLGVMVRLSSVMLPAGAIWMLAPASGMVSPEVDSVVPISRRGAEGVDGQCLLHTDRGSQSRSRKPVHRLNRHQMIGSMGRVGAAGDNAAMDSVFSLLQKNVLDRRVRNTREGLRSIVTWIERTDHRRRRQAARGRLTPVEDELSMKPAASQAASPRLSPVRAANPSFRKRA